MKLKSIVTLIRNRQQIFYKLHQVIRQKADMEEYKNSFDKFKMIKKISFNCSILS